METKNLYFIRTKTGYLSTKIQPKKADWKPVFKTSKLIGNALMYTRFRDARHDAVLAGGTIIKYSFVKKAEMER